MRSSRRPGPVTAGFPGPEAGAAPRRGARRAPDAPRPAQGLAWAVALSAPFWAILAAFVWL
jgi:hypothetical protein